MSCASFCGGARLIHAGGVCRGLGWGCDPMVFVPEDWLKGGPGRAAPRGDAPRHCDVAYTHGVAAIVFFQPTTTPAAACEAVSTGRVFMESAHSASRTVSMVSPVGTSARTRAGGARRAAPPVVCAHDVPSPGHPSVSCGRALSDQRSPDPKSITRCSSIFPIVGMRVRHAHAIERRLRPSDDTM